MFPSSQTISVSFRTLNRFIQSLKFFVCKKRLSIFGIENNTSIFNFTYYGLINFPNSTNAFVAVQPDIAMFRHVSSYTAIIQVEFDIIF